MASIASLLNPLPEELPTLVEQALTTPGPAQTNCTKDVDQSETSVRSRVKRQKMAKDAPIFKLDKPRGEIRYPPCEDRDEQLKKEHERFELFPMGEEKISDFPRHVPYNSEKKSFLEKTGRECFEVYQYTFRIPGVDKTWAVMWDYNVGLVRTTHLFKCNDYSKTTPAKMLNANPGLRDVCHSITGGALAAQGYWMPFEAAKAVAATFCWKIRFALTPLFGLDFPSMCVPPSDRARFGKMVISPAIINRVTECAKYYKTLQIRASAGLSAENLQSPPICNACTRGPLSIFPTNSQSAKTDLTPGLNDEAEKCVEKRGHNDSFGSSVVSSSLVGNPCGEPTPKSTPVRCRSTPSQEIWDFVKSRTRIPDSEDIDFNWKLDIRSVSAIDGAANTLASPTELDSEDEGCSDHGDDDYEYSSEDSESVTSVSMRSESSSECINLFQRRKNGKPQRHKRPLELLCEEVTAAEALLTLHTREIRAWNFDKPLSPPSTCASSPTSKRGIEPISFSEGWPSLEGSIGGKKRRRASA